MAEKYNKINLKKCLKNIQVYSKHMQVLVKQKLREY